MYDKGAITMRDEFRITMIIVDDDDNELVRLRDIRFKQLSQLLDIIFKSGYDVLVGRQRD